MQSSQKNNRKRIVRILGNVLMVLAFGFILRRLWIYRKNLNESVNGTVVAVLALSVLIYGGVVLIQALAYRILAQTVCMQPIPAAKAVPLYAKSNLYKYLPGNVLHFVGRNQIAEECSVSHADVAFATVLEIAIQCMAAVLTGVILSFGFVADYLKDKVPVLIGGALIIIIGAAACALVVKKKFSARWERIRTLAVGEGRRSLIRVVLLHLLIQVTNGLLFLVLLQAMGGNIPAGICPHIVGIYCFAWLVGFVTPGAPGGLGIREAMLSLFLGTLADPGLIAAAVLLNRVVTVLGDLAAFLYSIILYRDKDGDSSEK